MLIRVTNCCTMGCKHCMVDSSGPDGEHMTMETFKAAVDFAQSVAAKVILLTGGEPFEHPKLEEMAGHLRRLDKFHVYHQATLITTNGSWIDDPEKVKLARELELPIQVTNDPRYYPKILAREKFRRIPGVSFESNLRVIFPCRRTKENRIKPTRISPTCFNLRSATRSTGGLAGGIRAIEQMGKHCSPAVNVDGTIVTGEADTCHSIGTVHDDVLTIERNLKTMKCNRCGLNSNLSPLHLKAIGEKDAQEEEVCREHGSPAR
jgi:hypothetical protein